MPRPSLRPAICLVAVLVVVVGCAGPTVSTSSSSPPSTVPGPSAVVTPIPPTIRPTAAPPSNPASEPPASSSTAWPSVPEAPVADADGTLLLMHVRWNDTGGAAPMLAILADGRVVLRRETADGSGRALSRRSLSPSGLELVRAALVDVGLFDRDRTRQLIKPLHCCGAGDQLRVRLGDETVRVGRVLAFPENYEPSAAWDRFDALVEDLLDIDGWLLTDAWADEWAPYHAPQFCLEVGEDSPGGPGLAVDAVTWPAGVRPFASFGQEGWSSDTRVGTIDAWSAYALAASITEQANAAVIANDGWYRVPLEDGGALRFPTIHDGATDWRVSLDPLMPRWQECTSR